MVSFLFQFSSSQIIAGTLHSPARCFHETDGDWQIRGNDNEEEKGIFFDDDDFEHMSCSVVASWGKIGMTEVRICDQEDLKKCEIFR